MSTEPTHDQSEKTARLNSRVAVGSFNVDGVLERLVADWPVERWRDVTVVVAVSGGPDSVALLRMLDQLKREPSDGRLVVAHFDHGWRDDSNQDSQFVSALAKQLGWECVIGRAKSGSDDVSTSSATGKQSSGSEDAARSERYGFLQSVARDLSLIHIPSPRDATLSRMPSSA